MVGTAPAVAAMRYGGGTSVPNPLVRMLTCIVSWPVCSCWASVPLGAIVISAATAGSQANFAAPQCGHASSEVKMAALQFRLLVVIWGWSPSLLQAADMWRRVGSAIAFRTLALIRFFVFSGARVPIWLCLGDGR